MMMEAIRRDLLQDLAQLREGKITVSQAKARALLARNIIESVKLDLIAQRMSEGDLGAPPQRTALSIAA